MIYRILPSQRLLFLWKLLIQQYVSFCEADDGTLEHMFWDCAKTQVSLLDFVDWLCTNVSHCRQLRLSKELVIFGYNNPNVYTDNILDTFILLAKYQITSCQNNLW